jgi:hypothetical protein
VCVVRLWRSRFLGDVCERDCLAHESEDDLLRFVEAIYFVAAAQGIDLRLGQTGVLCERGVLGEHVGGAREPTDMSLPSTQCLHRTADPPDGPVLCLQ